MLEVFKEVSLGRGNKETFFEATVIFIDYSILLEISEIEVTI